jgi:hypothetical protein
MGLALPLFGYVLPKGQRYLLEDPDSAWNRQAHEGIREFGRTFGRLAPTLSDFIYPQDLSGFPPDLVVEIVLETDPMERPGMRRLLRDLRGDGPGSIVVPNLSHLRLSADHAAAEHRALLTEITHGMVPVFTTQLGSGRTLVSEIKRDEANAYFTMADNYAGTRNTLEKHLAQFPSDQRP